MELVSATNLREKLKTMKRLRDITLTPDQSEALAEIQRRLAGEFDVDSVILFGSVTRGELDEESDIDLLVLTPHPLTRPARHKITDMVFEVNLRYNTNFSTLVVDRISWEEGPISVLPIRNEILKDGVAL